MFMLRIIIILLLFLTPVAALSKVGFVDFTDLLDDTDLVIYGTAVGAFYNDDGSGYGLVRVKKVMFGNSQEQVVKIFWTSDRYEAKISKLLSESVFFLKKAKDGYTGSSLERSQWEVIPIYKKTAIGYIEVVDGGVVLPFAVNNIHAELFARKIELDCSVYNDCERERITIWKLSSYLHKASLKRK